MRIDDTNARGGANGQKLELVTLDSKANPQEALIAFKQLTDQGVRCFFQGNSCQAVGCDRAAVPQVGSSGVKYDVECTGYGFRSEGRVGPRDTMLPTTCKMQRP